MAENQDDKIKETFAQNLNNVTVKYFGGKNKALADKLKISTSGMSLFASGKRLPVFNIVEKLYKSGISIDYLISGMGNELIHGSKSFDDIEAYINGDIFEVEVKDDKMSTTMNHSSIATFRKINIDDLEVGNIYMIEKAKGNKFIARLISEDYHFVYDNPAYKDFQYEPKPDDSIAKLTKIINYHFPIQQR